MERAMADEAYQVTISMSSETVGELAQFGALLYGFKAVQCSDAAGRPLLWYATSDYSMFTEVAWSESYQAYTSSSPITVNKQIFVGFSASISLGQTMNVEANGIGKVVEGGVAAAISISNVTATPFTCGIAQPNNATSTSLPLCAFPLYGHNLQIITPLAKVLLLFASVAVELGTVIEYFTEASIAAYTPALLIDLTNAPQNQCSVGYDINTGWSWDASTKIKAQQVAANADLVPLLIEASPGEI
jgi:hypothetical protein